MKKVLVLGGGGFIGGHLAKKLKEEGCWVRVVDIKMCPEFFSVKEICHEYISADLRDSLMVSKIMFAPDQKRSSEGGFDEVYQLAADMGGAGYVFSGENDAEIIRNSSLININVAHECVKKGVKRVFYSSSACVYPEHNQMDPDNPFCVESSAYPANPDSEYGWEKLFSERLYFAYRKNHGLSVRVARFHNVFGPNGTYRGGREKAPAALIRKVVEARDGDSIEVWGDGKQTRSFLFVEDCVDSVIRLMRNDRFVGPVNIGSEEMVTINDLASKIIRISGKNLTIKNIPGPQGVRGRTSDNALFESSVGPCSYKALDYGLKKTYKWISDITAKRD